MPLYNPEYVSPPEFFLLEALDQIREDSDITDPRWLAESVGEVIAGPVDGGRRECRWSSYSHLSMQLLIHPL